jgi:hexokinase
MALAEEAKRVAAEFDYPAEELNKGVKYFIARMEEGLSKKGALMAQIPTYVTKVPNGTEKVGSDSRSTQASV